MTLPASLTVLMKLRLMNTPVRIHPPSSRMSVPTTPMWAWSISETPMPKAPPQPVEEQRLQRSPKAKPRVSDPRMRISSSERIEWLSSSGRWRMMRMPTSTSMQGSRMPKTPNELSTSMRPMRAPASPQRFSTSSPNSSRSSAGRCRMLWSTSHVKNEKKTEAATNRPMKSSSSPAIQRALSLLERATVCRRPEEADVLFLDAMCFLDARYYRAKIRKYLRI